MLRSPCCARLHAPAFSPLPRCARRTAAPVVLRLPCYVCNVAPVTMCPFSRCPPVPFRAMFPRDKLAMIPLRCYARPVASIMLRPSRSSTHAALLMLCLQCRTNHAAFAMLRPTCCARHAAPVVSDLPCRARPTAPVALTPAALFADPTPCCSQHQRSLMVGGPQGPNIPGVIKRNPSLL